MNIIKIGIIGTGMIAHKHVESLQKIEKVDVSWVAGRNQEKLKRFQEQYNIGQSTTNYHEMLADDELDAVIIATPPNSHVKIFEDVLNAGKNCLLEKPPAILIKDISKLKQLIADHPNLIISACSSRHSRLQPKYKKIKEIIDSGVCGKIYYIHHNCVQQQSRGGIEYHPEAKWFMNREIAGAGPLYDWGLYDMSFHLGLLNDKPELEKISDAFVARGLDNIDVGDFVNDVEEHFATSLQFSGGLRYYWERSIQANMEAANESRIYGTRGGIKVSFCTWEENTDIEFFSLEDGVNGKVKKEIFKINVDNQIDEFELAMDFVHTLRTGDKPTMPLELELKHMEILMRINDVCLQNQLISPETIADKS